MLHLFAVASSEQVQLAMLSSAPDELSEWIFDLETSSPEFIIIVVVEERKSPHRPWHFSTHDLCSLDARRRLHSALHLDHLRIKNRHNQSTSTPKIVFSLSEFNFGDSKLLRACCAEKSSLSADFSRGDWGELISFWRFWSKPFTLPSRAPLKRSRPTAAAPTSAFVSALCVLNYFPIRCDASTDVFAQLNSKYIKVRCPSLKWGIAQPVPCKAPSRRLLSWNSSRDDLLCDSSELPSIVFRVFADLIM